MICRRLVNDDITGGHGLANFCQGAEAIAQTVRCELRIILGEWFLDVTKGVPWIRNRNAGADAILGRFPTDISYAEATIKAAVLRIDGVKSLTSFTLDLNHATRAATCRISGLLETGTAFAITEGIL
jgi:hypothetical protein